MAKKLVIQIKAPVADKAAAQEIYSAVKTATANVPNVRTRAKVKNIEKLDD